MVDADDGHLEGEAVKDGRIIEFHADARTGKITQSQPKIEDLMPGMASAARSPKAISLIDTILPASHDSSSTQSNGDHG